MKKIVLSVMLILFAIASCTKDETFDDEFDSLYSLEYEMYLNWSPAPTSLKGMPTKGVCREQSYDLIAGQTINVGDMMVSNDDEFLFHDLPLTE